MFVRSLLRGKLRILVSKGMSTCPLITPARSTDSMFVHNHAYRAIRYMERHRHPATTPVHSSPDTKSAMSSPFSATGSANQHVPILFHGSTESMFVHSAIRYMEAPPPSCPYACPQLADTKAAMFHPPPPDYKLGRPLLSRGKTFLLANNLVCWIGYTFHESTGAIPQHPSWISPHKLSSPRRSLDGRLA